MRLLVRFLLACLFGLIGIRTLLYLAYASMVLPRPYEASYLEAKMVHLAWRVQHGVRLYPEWTTGPYVSNFFGPVYFGLVGGIGRLLGVSLDTLPYVGRGVSFAASLGAAVLVGVWVGRRHGRSAGLLAGMGTLGSGPTFGISVMTRPDALADLLGLAGFLLVTGGRRPVPRALGAGVLVLAALTKQTALAFLLAAGLGLYLEGRRGVAGGIVLGAMAALLVIVGLADLAIEPNLVPSLLGESRTPWDVTAWLRLLWRFAFSSPEFVVLAIFGLVCWSRLEHRSRPLLALTVVLLLVSVVTSAKQGAALNYFLSARLPAAMAVGILWESARRQATIARAGLLVLVIVSFLPGLYGVTLQLANEETLARMSRSPRGKWTSTLLKQAQKLAQDPRRSILTDYGPIDIYQGERTLFGDPWLFRMMAETGQIDTTPVERRVAARSYEFIFTQHDLMAPDYDTAFDFSLPRKIADLAREHYEPVPDPNRSSLHVYQPRGGAPPSSR